MFEMDVNNGVKQEVIKVIGVGGGGGNAVNRMIGSGTIGVEYIVMNTDAQVLQESEAPVRMQLGPKTTKGHGAGGFPDIGMKSAEESEAEIMEALDGADMVFITAGMGGGTGTGAAPIVARIAKSMGILTVAIVTKPFTRLEGPKQTKKAEKGIEELKKHVDTLIVIPNDKILQLCPKGTKIQQAFQEANQVLQNGVRAVTDLIEIPGIVNVDFADIRATMIDKGVGHIGIGSASGEDRAVKAAEAAINSPLLETTVAGAERLLVSIAAGKGGPDLDEFGEISSYVMEAVDNIEVDVILGTAEVPELEDEIRVTVIATGFNEAAMAKKVEAAEEPEKEEDGLGLSERSDEDVLFSSVGSLDFQIPDWINPKKRK
ncbi:MAG: cell division protein FtsZ [Peptostreptococcaceae bacterium]|nr:cell division protein FtsZ [Peptostreptococcaceae bacterium]